MPRYYRRRYTRVVKPKKKWASNIKVWNNDTLNEGTAALLATNSVQDTATPTPSILKVGNFKVSADIFFISSDTLSGFNPVCIGYIVYVPEGWGTSALSFDDLIVKHPEWIMATKTSGSSLSSSSATGGRFAVDSMNVSTRLKRNLNSGDSIYFYIKANV